MTACTNLPLSIRLEAGAQDHVLHMWQIFVDPLTGLQSDLSHHVARWRQSRRCGQATLWEDAVAVISGKRTVVIVNGDARHDASWNSSSWKTSSILQSVRSSSRLISETKVEPFRP
jgi:hypothetical protein